MCNESVKLVWWKGSLPLSQQQDFLWAEEEQDETSFIAYRIMQNPQPSDRFHFKGCFLNMLEWKFKEFSHSLGPIFEAEYYSTSMVILCNKQSTLINAKKTMAFLKNYTVQIHE